MNTVIELSAEQLSAIKAYNQQLIDDQKAGMIKVRNMRYGILPLLADQIILDLTYTYMEGGKMYSTWKLWSFDKHGQKHDKSVGLSYDQSMQFIEHLIPIEIKNNKIIIP